MATLRTHRNTVQFADRNRRNTRRVSRKISIWKLAKWTCYALLAYQVYGGITQMIQDITLASDQYKLESVCIREKIALGIERIDIATKDGTCWVEANGYYNYH